jgi:hypothetical protein
VITRKELLESAKLCKRQKLITQMENPHDYFYDERYSGPVYETDLKLHVNKVHSELGVSNWDLGCAGCGTIDLSRFKAQMQKILNVKTKR